MRIWIAAPSPSSAYTGGADAVVQLHILGCVPYPSHVVMLTPTRHELKRGERRERCAAAYHDTRLDASAPGGCGAGYAVCVAAQLRITEGHQNYYFRPERLVCLIIPQPVDTFCFRCRYELVTRI
jgi:hypothetical protein